MPVTEWKSPSTVTGAGWSVLSGTLAEAVANSDNVYARHIDGTDDLKTKGYGFSLPVGALVDGVEVWIEAGRVFQYDVTRVETHLTLDGDTKAGEPRTSTFGHLVDQIEVHGNPVDKYGLPLTRAQVNDPNFGVIFEFENIEVVTEIRVDHIQMRIHYSDAGTGLIPADLASRMRRIPPGCGVRSRQAAKRKD